MARLVIDNEQLAEDYFEHAHLLGIQCAAEPHRFVWLVNRHFGFDFRYLSGSEILLKKKQRDFNFPVFQFDEPNMDVTHILYTNRFDGEYLLPELRHTDYLWLVRGELQVPEFLPLLEAELRGMTPVQLVTTLNNDKIKHKQHLVM